MSASLDPSNPQKNDRWPTGGFWLALWSISAAFGTYFCMYAFRKPFTAATFADATLWGIGYKTVLVSTQVLGYTVSKFIGIKVVAEMTPPKRAAGILLLVATAELSLILFGVIPNPFNFVFLFFNGLSLGMVFGLVLGFLEGRKQTEALAAGLCASFILADGVTKSVGAWLLQSGANEYWMPAIAGLLFLAPLGLFVWMLARIPPPNVEDLAERSERLPLNRVERSRLFWRYAPGLAPLLIMYLLITILRSMRADFAPELWKGLGEATPPNIFTRSEMLVALGVMVVNGCGVLIRDNRRAFLTALMTSMAGLGLIAFAAATKHAAAIDGFSFMVLVGLGLYLPYVAMHTTIFERLIAMTRDRGNIGYFMYLADAIGYLGYVAVMLFRALVSVDDDFIGFFFNACWLVVGLSAICLVLSWIYFSSPLRCQPTVDSTTG